MHHNDVASKIMLSQIMIHKSDSVKKKKKWQRVQVFVSLGIKNIQI